MWLVRELQIIVSVNIQRARENKADQHCLWFSLLVPLYRCLSSNFSRRMAVVAAQIVLVPLVLGKSCVCVYIIMALLLIAILLFRELNSTRKPKLCFKNSLNVKRLDKLKEELAELSYNRACKNINIAH